MKNIKRDNQDQSAREWVEDENALDANAMTYGFHKREYIRN
jgi:hypothetical protein